MTHGRFWHVVRRYVARLRSRMRTSALRLSLVRSLSLAPLAVASWSGSPDSNCNYPFPQQEQRRPQPQPQHQRHHQYQQHQSQGPPQQQGHQQEFYHDPGPYHYTKVAQMENMSPSVSQGVAVNGPQDSKVPIEDLVPQRYVIGCQGDMAEASRRWRATCKWRRENDVDGVIERPQPWFHRCREVFPVYVHGRSRKGLPVLWEQIGKVNLPRAEELDLPLSEILPNYVFLNECIWRVILDKGENDNDDAKFITVEDVAGVRLWHLTPKILSIVRSLTGTMKAHYVERCHKSYIINAPRAFMALWRIISPMLDPRTRAKITIVGTNYVAALAEEIDPSQLPAEYGGTSGRPIYDSDDERKIQALVARLNAGGTGVVNRRAVTGSNGYGVHGGHGAPPRPLA